MAKVKKPIILALCADGREPDAVRRVIVEETLAGSLVLRAGGGALALEEDATVCAGVLGRAAITCPVRYGADASAFDSMPRLQVAAAELEELRAALLATGRQVCEVGAEEVIHG